MKEITVDMGFDLTGIQPSGMTIPQPLDWSNKRESEEYFNLLKTVDGAYFRNNNWWWRPLWNFCAHHCPELIDEETHLSGHCNDGAGLNAEDAVKLGTKLLVLIEDGTASAHEKEIILSNEEAQAKDPDNGLAGAYPFSVENVKEFADFCIQSGGFKIW